MELEQPPESEQDKLEGRWQYGNDRLEYTLRKSFGGDVALAKNIVLGVTYYHTKAKGDAAGRDPKSNVLWSELNLTF